MHCLLPSISFPLFLSSLSLSLSLLYYNLSTHTLIIIRTTIPPPCPTRPKPAKRVPFPRISSRSPVSPTPYPRCPKPRASRMSRSTIHQCPGSMPPRVKQRCVHPSLPPFGWKPFPNFSSQLKKALSNNVGAAQTLAYATSVSRSRRPTDCARAFQTENFMQPTTVNPSHNPTSQAIMMRKPVSFFGHRTSWHSLTPPFIGSNKTTGLMVTQHTTQHYRLLLVALGTLVVAYSLIFFLFFSFRISFACISS